MRNQRTRWSMLVVALTTGLVAGAAGVVAMTVAASPVAGRPTVAVAAINDVPRTLDVPASTTAPHHSAGHSVPDPEDRERGPDHPKDTDHRKGPARRAATGHRDGHRHCHAHPGYDGSASHNAARSQHAHGDGRAVRPCRQPRK